MFECSPTSGAFEIAGASTQIRSRRLPAILSFNVTSHVRYEYIASLIYFSLSLRKHTIEIDVRHRIYLVANPSLDLCPLIKLGKQDRARLPIVLTENRCTRYTNGFGSAKMMNR